MRNRKESHSGIRQNAQTVKKSQKHDANLQKNSTLYFQVGLIVCLLFTYGMFEMKFETKLLTYSDPPVLDEPYSIDIPLIKPVKPEIQESVKQKKVKQIKDFIEVDNDKPIVEKILDVPEDPVEDKNPPIDLGDIDIETPPTESTVEFIRVEQVPLYPGCERKKGREAQSKCMSEKINKLIQRKFDVSLADELGLSGTQKIDVQFMINKSGEVTGIKARAPHPLLEKEAKRVMDMIPSMKPGKQRDKPVIVRFNQPIRFQVHN